MRETDTKQYQHFTVAQLKEALVQAATIVDSLNHPIDRGIAESVAVLRLLGINTFSSCWGHADRLTGGPYVMFKSSEAKDLEPKLQAINDPLDPKFKRLRAKLVRANLRERAKLLPLLEDFYEGRPTPFGQRLIIEGIGVEGSRLKVQNIELMAVDRGGRRQILSAAQAEMRAFTEFLKDKALTPERLAA